MVRSMTAYARAVSEEISGLAWTCEIHSVNRKTLELYLHMPHELLFLDLQLRKMVTDTVKRGQVNVRLSFRGDKGRAFPSIQLLKKFKNEWISTAKELAFDPAKIDLTFLLGQMDRFPLKDVVDSEVQAIIKSTLQQALDMFVEMKETEGRALARDVEKRLKCLLTINKKIEKRSAVVPENYRNQLIERLSSLMEDVANDERVLREVVLLAEKADVTEELVRLRSHIDQFHELLESNRLSTGRTLEFLTQEMLREINTVAAKSHDLEVTKMAVEGKAEMEKIREQVQNIE